MSEPIDTENRDEIIFPWCGAIGDHRGYAWWMNDPVKPITHSIVCEGCGRTFQATQHVTITYTTSKA